MPAVSIVLLNQKGGVGKTSAYHHLAGTLAQGGKKILLVDNDPQASLTQGLFGPQATRDLDPSQTIAAIYSGIAFAPTSSPSSRPRRSSPPMDAKGWNAARLAEELHIRDSTIFKALALLELPGEVRERVATGEIKPATAYELSQLDRPQD